MIYDVRKLPHAIEIGFTGEHKFRKIQIDMSAWMELVPASVPSIVYIQPGKSAEDAYAVTTTFDSDDNILTWEITETDLGTERGTGVAQVWLEDATEELVLNKRGMSAVFYTKVDKCVGTGTPGEPSQQLNWEEKLALKVDKANIANNLTTTGEGKVLDARQGKALNDGKLNISDVANNLTTTGEGKVLDARQGKALNDGKLNISDVANNLTTTEEGKALDARQGYVLEEKKVNRHTGLEEGKFLQTDENGDAVWGSPASEEVIRDAAEGWMDDHVSQGETLAIDNTLTLSGYAADSKVTGDKLTEIKSALSEKTQNIWKYGDVNNVTGYVAVIRSDDDNYIPAGTYTLSAEIERATSGNCRMYFYKDAYATSDLLASPYLASGERNSTTFTLDYDAHVVLVASGPNVSSTAIASWKKIQIESGTVATAYIPSITATDFKARNDIVAQGVLLSGEIDEQSNRITGYDEMYIRTPEIGWSAEGDNKYLTETGETGNNNAYHYSDLIPVDEGFYRFLWLMGSTAAGGNFRVHGYDSNGDWVKQICVFSSTLFQQNEFAYFYVDSTISFVRISIKKSVVCTIDKLVGDHFGSPVAWAERGLGYNDGSVTSATNRIHTIHPINADYSIQCETGYQVGVFAYEPDVSFVGVWNGTELVTGSVTWFESVNIKQVLNAIGTEKLIFLSVRKSDDSSISLSDSSHIKYVYMDVDPVAPTQDIREINILMIGNSFTRDENAYLPALLKEALPNLHFRIGILYQGNTVLEDHASYMQSDTAYDKYDEYNWSGSSWSTSSDKKPSAAITICDWDIITFTSANRSWVDVDTDIIPYLGQLIDGYSAMVSKNVKFALFLSHIYADGYSPVTTTSADFYNDTIAGMTRVFDTMPIFDLIQTGTAIENARTTTLKQYGSGTYKDMTYDGRHLQEGICCLVPAYLMLMKVADLVGENKVGDFGSKIRPDDTFISAQNIPGQHGSSQGVTDANCLLAAKCAMMAYKHPYTITDCSGFNPV